MRLRIIGAVRQRSEDDRCYIADKHYQDDEEHETVQYIVNCPSSALTSTHWNDCQVCAAARTSAGRRGCPDIVTSLKSVADVRRLLQTLVGLFPLRWTVSLLASCWVRQIASSRRSGLATGTRL